MLAFQNPLDASVYSKNFKINPNGVAVSSFIGIALGSLAAVLAMCEHSSDEVFARRKSISPSLPFAFGTGKTMRPPPSLSPPPRFDLDFGSNELMYVRNHLFGGSASGASTSHVSLASHACSGFSVGKTMHM